MVYIHAYMHLLIHTRIFILKLNSSPPSACVPRLSRIRIYQKIIIILNVNRRAKLCKKKFSSRYFFLIFYFFF